ncbi:MAG: inorganic diphosphatase [Pseudomonadales bacterium]
MGLKSVGPGANTPDEINVIIEIPANSAPVKYEVDKESGAVFVDRFMSTPMFYPCNYGYVPESLALDDDPLDVLVVTPFPLISGTVIEARPVGVMNMIDEAGDDSKLVCVPIDRLSRLYRQIRNYNDLPSPLIEQLGHFFAHYKDLEPNKWVEIKGWEGPDEARRQIVEALELYKKTS